MANPREKEKINPLNVMFYNVITSWQQYKIEVIVSIENHLTMKNTILITLIFITLAFSLSSCKKVKNQSAIVSKSCAGLYIIIDSKNYEVCNNDILDSFNSNDKVLVDYKKIKKCENPNYIAGTCYILIDFEDLIEIKEIGLE